MIQLSSFRLQRGTRVLLDDANLTVHAGQKVGIVGANGTGKTSLFKLLQGQLEGDAGDFSLPAGWRIAHMAQEVLATERSAVDYVLDGDEKLRQLQQQIATAEATDDSRALGHLFAELEACDGYSARARAEQLLHGLGFTQAQVEQPVQAFSGGWRIRLNLAQALMCPSDLLLLDEPTNHLDLDASLWLEQWLCQYVGTLLLISHDRDFLDRVATHIVHIEHQKLNSYRGNYTSFERTRAEQLAQQQAMYEKQQVRKAEIDSFVRRFKAKASKAKQAQSRLKELTRMVELAPAHVDSPFSFSFQCNDKMSSPLLAMQKADIGYDQPLLQSVSLNLQPGMRVGLLGHNGAGKSTLIKALLGELDVLAGERALGANASIGYFAQHQLEALDLNASPQLHLQRLSPDASEQSIRNFLGSFDFVGEGAEAPVQHFSGGEKARLALAILAWQRPNLLLMDEPTNHLDLDMRHALLLALQQFEGALILVSHDRHLLRHCVDEFWLVDAGRVTEFDGDLDDYAKQSLAQAAAESVAEPELSSEDSAAAKRERKRQEAEQRQRRAPLKKAVAELEKKLDGLHQQLQGLEDTLAQPHWYEADHKADLKALLQQQADAQKQLDDIEAQWLEQSEALEAFE